MISSSIGLPVERQMQNKIKHVQKKLLALSKTNPKKFQEQTTNLLKSAKILDKNGKLTKHYR
jgi:hypothetical protein